MSRVELGAERREREQLARDVEHVVGLRLGVVERGVELGDVRVGELEDVAVAEIGAAPLAVRLRAARVDGSIVVVIADAPSGRGLRAADEATRQRAGRLAALVGDLARDDRGDVAVGRLHEPPAAGGQVVAHLRAGARVRRSKSITFTSAR